MAKLWRLVVQKLRLVGFRVRFGGGGSGHNIAIGSGVRFSVTDGGRLNIGRGAEIEGNAIIQAKFGSLAIGDHCFIGSGSVIVARESIVIGDHALIAEYVTIRDQDHRISESAPTAQNGFVTRPIVIGRNVWLGAKTTVLKGVTIGDNAVVGANSVVTRDVPANTIVVGNPARPLHEIGEA